MVRWFWTDNRAGKIKGIERFLGAVETLETTLIEVSSGAAKYEHQHRAIVWRMPRLPKEGQGNLKKKRPKCASKKSIKQKKNGAGSYTTHTFSCRINLTSFDQMPETLGQFCHVEFTMPATNVSHTTLRSLAVSTGDPPEKYAAIFSFPSFLFHLVLVLKTDMGYQTRGSQLMGSDPHGGRLLVGSSRFFSYRFNRFFT